MATTIPRAARYSILDSSSIELSRFFGQTSTRRSRFSESMQRGSRYFSSAQRYAATPAPSFARRADGDTKPIPPSRTASSIDDQSPIKDMRDGLADEPLILDEGARQVDWTRSFHGLSAEPFSKETADILLAPIPADDVEVKPDGIIYLPEIKYRRILNKAFGPGGWGLAPRGETIVTGKSVTREYALVAHGRYGSTFDWNNLDVYIFISVG
jgi:hypothetical protein